MHTDSSGLFIHVGYPKAASTTLQVNLFSKHPEIDYLGKHYASSCKNGTWAKDNIWTTVENKILLKTETQKIHWKNIKEIYSNSKDLPLIRAGSEAMEGEARSIHDLHRAIVLSNEGFLNGAWQPVEEVPQRLKKYFPNASILIVIRNQFDLLESLYFQLNKQSYLDSVRRKLSFRNWMELELKHIDKSFIRTLRYKEFIDKYLNSFGSENVHIFLMEELQNNLPSFCQKISNVLDVDEEKTIELLSLPRQNSSKLKLGILDKFSRAVGLSAASKVKGRPFTKWKPEHLLELEKIFSKTNRALQEARLINLEQYGYIV